MLSSLHRKETVRVFFLHFFIWLLIFSFPIVDSITGYRSFKIWRLLIPVGIFYFNYFYLVPRLLLRKMHAAYIIFIILLVILTSHVLLLLEPPELPPFASKLLPPEQRGLLHLRIFPFTAMMILHISISTLLRIYSQLNVSLRQQAETQAQKKIVELNLLKAQLNPHFFFNSLNTIYSLSIKRSSKTSEAILNLADLMRYMLYETNRDLVRLEQDILYIENYIELQKLRLTANNRIELKVEGELQGIVLPPLLFISFIENAFKYGTSSSQKSSIIIEFIINEGILTFKIINDVHPSASLKLSENGMGIKNAVERVKLYFPDKNIFRSAVAEGKYTVELTLFLK
jgi:two-component system, LytTR family, sensor kinase